MSCFADTHQEDSVLKDRTDAPGGCQTCGLPLEKGRRRYCSDRCKEEFVFKLRWFNNLLRVLNTRFATFTFTESFLILNVITTDSAEVMTYFYRRLPGKKPSQDIDGMVFGLGEIWWGQKNRTKSERFASKHVLKQGLKQVFSAGMIKPVEFRSASLPSRNLTCLQLKKDDLLQASEPERLIKSAYRKAAIKNHPDHGGDSESFRSVHRAYQDLLLWLKRPTYQTRKGVPGQWSYLAGRSNWLTPL